MSERDYNEIFKKNYLSTVECSVRFPPLLIIQNMIPEFQQLIRDELPLIKKSFNFLSPEFEDLPTEPSKWMFISEDKKKRLKIDYSNIVFIVEKYHDFLPFYTELIGYLKNFFNLCDIKKFNRIALNYINEIPLKALKEQKNISILEYFNPAFDQKTFDEYDITKFQINFTRTQEKNRITTVNYFNKAPQRELYVIDIDAYNSSKSTMEDLEKIINELHESLVQEFHNNIKDKFLEFLREESNR